MSLEGKSILLTGGAGGIGARLATRLTGKGARVTVLDRVAPTGSASYMRCDLATSAGQDAACEIAAEPWNILINLAGVQHFGPLTSQSPEQLTASYMVNLVAPVRLAQAALPAMKGAGGGQIVNVGSVFGSIAFAHFVSYSSSKAGLFAFSQALRRELAGAGIDVTHIAPRAVRTPLNSPSVMAFAKATGMRLDDPDWVADRMLQAIEARRKDVFLGFPESAFVRLNALLPRLVDRALAANDRKAAALFPARPFPRSAP
ncbi:MAG: SDR family NAD(P)-dependent oxidoreductase [Proteobacteria bacterium]|nr:SDR family NAD(P)-dependent oxidoreductase [Pseudomonadota bacterium]